MSYSYVRPTLQPQQKAHRSRHQEHSHSNKRSVNRSYIRPSLHNGKMPLFLSLERLFQHLLPT